MNCTLFCYNLCNLFLYVLFQKRGKEKNRIDLNQIKVVEPVADGAFQDRQNGIQVCSFLFNIQNILS